MVIEWLKVKLNGISREAYIQKDEEIWTAALAKFPGFLGKEVWIDPDQPEDVILVIHWANRDAWYSVPADSLEAIEKKFADALGKDTYKIVEGKEYQVRKFARIDKSQTDK